jgi:acyl carrier protein
MRTDDVRGRRERVVALIAEIREVPLDEVRPEARLREDLGMDSLNSLELLSAIGEELRIDLEIETAMQIATVDDACRFVEDAFAAQRGADA